MLSTLYMSCYIKSRPVSMRHGCPRGDCKVKLWDLLELSNTKIHKCKEHNIAENNLNRTISELDLCILVAHVSSEVQLKMSMNDRDNEWHSEIICIFKTKGHTSAEN